MLELHKYVELRQLIVRFQPVIEWTFVFEAKRCVVGVAQPFIEVRLWRDNLDERPCLLIDAGT
jgi:hypothetical protein